MRDRSVQGRHTRSKRRRVLTVVVVVVVTAFLAGLGVGAVSGWAVEHHGGVRHVLELAGRAVGAVPPASAREASTSPGESADPIPVTQHATKSAVSARALYATWDPPRHTPTAGRMVQVDIPGTISHFAARPALIYLPPAALVADPPPLPVVLLLAGQSRGASPEDLELKGHLSVTMNAIASANHGLAPIVVVPDQLRIGTNNPMCVNGPLGNSRDYLVRDVPDWIEAHLDVQTAASAWTIGGFSQGGTCAIQLGAGAPNVFGNLIDVSGELGPTLGTVEETVAKGFGGDFSAYEAAQPGALLRAHAPYLHEQAYFTAAQDDLVYGPDMPVVSALARQAGMSVTTLIIPHARHDWPMAERAIADGMNWLMPRIGIRSPLTVQAHSRIR